MNTAKGLSAEVAITESHVLVKRGTGNQEFTPTTAVNDTVLGFVTRTVDADDKAAVNVTDAVTKLRAKGAVTQDDSLMPSTTAGYVATAAGAGSTICAIALQDAADGDLFEVIYLSTHGTV